MWKIVLTWFENCQFVVWVAGWAPNILTFDNLTHTWKLFYFRKKKQKEYLLILQSHHPFLHKFFSIFCFILYLCLLCMVWDWVSVVLAPNELLWAHKSVSVLLNELCRDLNTSPTLRASAAGDCPRTMDTALIKIGIRVLILLIKFVTSRGFVWLRVWIFFSRSFRVIQRCYKLIFRATLC